MSVCGREKLLAEKITHMTDNDKQYVTGTISHREKHRLVNIPDVRAQENVVWWPCLFCRMNWFSGIPLTGPSPIRVVAMAKLGVLNHSFGGHEWLLQIIFEHFRQFLAR